MILSSTKRLSRVNLGAGVKRCRTSTQIKPRSCRSISTNPAAYIYPSSLSSSQPQRLFSNYSHGAVYNPKQEPVPSCPSCLISPGHYIQGPGIVRSVGHYAKSILKAETVGVLITGGNHKRIGTVLEDSFASVGVKARFETFQGVCSNQEIDRVTKSLKNRDNNGPEGPRGYDAIVAVGGGSCLDAGKLVADQFDSSCKSCASIIVSTLASTDAPCSALSILYSPEGVYEGGQVFAQSPNIVIVDTDIVSKAPVRTLVSGFGDALSTYYEARTCYENPEGKSMLEVRPTATALAMGSLCADLLYQHAVDAVQGVENNDTPTEALERVVEANTLLSGIGFESGGLACSHAVAQAMSWVPSVHSYHQHGEMVAIGLMTMLTMEQQAGLAGRDDEIKKVGKFLIDVGLPVCLEQLNFDPTDKSSMATFTDVALSQWFCHNEPFQVNKERIEAALLGADRIGRALKVTHGDARYRAVHNI